MARRRRRTGLDLAWATASASLEAQQVIALRLLKLSKGGAPAELEARRMIQEKLRTGARVGQEAVLSTLKGEGAAVAARAIASYRRTMRANRRRLIKELS